MNILYKDLESLNVLEQLDGKSYDFIYLDPPYYIHSNNNDYQQSKRRMSKDEKEQQAKREQKRYSEYISKIMENIDRLLKDDGILAFLTPMQEHSRIDWKTILEQFFPSKTNVTIRRKAPMHVSQGNPVNPDYLLYFCSKEPNHSFPILKEVPQGGRNEHALLSAFQKTIDRPPCQYEWHGITPVENYSWRYSKEKMDELFADGEIVIKNNKVYIWHCRDQAMPVPSTWNYTDKTRLRTSYLDSQSMERMFTMFVTSNSSLLCPYDRDGKFSYLADQHSFRWTSICPPGFPSFLELYSDIPENDYTVITKLKHHEPRTYKGGIITGIEDINELKEVMAKVGEIQNLVGADSPDEAIDEIQKLIDENVSESSIKDCLPEAQDWVCPYWDRLEAESQRFIPTGLTLYHQLLDDPDADMAAPMIEYCKALECELFTKLFAEYVIDLRDRHVNIQEEFPEAFENDETREFAEFLQRCLSSRNKNHPNRWKIEMGKMAHILTFTLDNNSQEPLFTDFRNYLDHAFEKGCFGKDFCTQLNYISRLRNDCAHPYLINSDKATEGREQIRNGILSILEYYKDEE